MNRAYGWMLAATLAVMTAAFAQPSPALALDPPDALIKRLSGEVIDRIKVDKEIQAGDFKKLSDFVDATVMPHVNFQRMTALAVGRNWRSANPDQQKQLMTEFRSLLLRTYSGALGSVKDQSIRIKPLRADPADLHWWELFSCVKGQAIWLGAARAFERGENTDLMMAFAAWMLSNSQDRAILELMGQLP